MKCLKLHSVVLSDGQYYELVRANFERADRMCVVRFAYFLPISSLRSAFDPSFLSASSQPKFLMNTCFCKANVLSSCCKWALPLSPSLSFSSSALFFSSFVSLPFFHLTDVSERNLMPNKCDLQYSYHLDFRTMEMCRTGLMHCSRYYNQLLFNWACLLSTAQVWWTSTDVP